MTSDSEYDVEPVPEADAAEQGRPLTDEPADDSEGEVEPTQEADPADVAEQRRAVPEDEEYETG